MLIFFFYFFKEGWDYALTILKNLVFSSTPARQVYPVLLPTQKWYNKPFMITNLNESYKLKTEISVVIHRKITVGFMPLVRTLFHVFFKILSFYSCHVTNNKKNIFWQNHKNYTIHDKIIKIMNIFSKLFKNCKRFCSYRNMLSLSLITLLLIAVCQAEWPNYRGGGGISIPLLAPFPSPLQVFKLKNFWKIYYILYVVLFPLNLVST